MALIDYIQSWLDRLSQSGEFSRALVTIASAGGLVIFLYLVLKLVFSFIKALRLCVFSQFWYRQNLVAKYGKWAVITGATDGIGRAIAFELARQGMSIVVVGRNEEKLANTKRALMEVPNVGEVETLRVDLSQWSMDKVELVRAQLDPDNRDIGVLVNNAGLAPAMFIRFVCYQPESMMDILNVNALATVLFTRLVLPGMLERSRGLIMNVSSMSGSIVWPWLNIYAPSKAFVNSFTRQLQTECRSSNVDIVLLHTGPVLTKLTDSTGKRKPNLMVPSAETYARSAIRAQSTGINEFSGHWAHDLWIFFLDTMTKLGLLNFTMNVIRKTRSPT